MTMIRWRPAMSCSSSLARTSRTSWPGCCTASGELPGLGDLGAPLERVRELLAISGLRHLFLKRPAGFFGQLDLQQVPRRRGMVAPHHDHVREEFLERRGQLGPVRGRAADHAAQEPAGPVYAHEPDRLQLLTTRSGAGWVDPRVQFGAERAILLLAFAA